MLTVTVNDRPIDVAAIVERSRVLLPMRATFAALGATVTYDPRGRVIVARGPAHELRLRIGSSRAFVDGRALPLDVPARIAAARAYVPLRFVAQAFGAIVGYDARANIVSIVTPNTVGAGATPAPDSDVVPNAIPSISPGLPDGPAFDSYNYRFYANGPGIYYPGDWMHFTLLAPPGGSAQLDLCGLGVRYALWNHGSGSVYEANVPVPSGYWIPSCTVTAVYTSWTGQQYYVPVPVVIAIYTRPQAGRPTPSPTPHAIPHPGGPRRIEPTPAPIPRAAATPHPAPTSHIERTAHPIAHPLPRQTP